MIHIKIKRSSLKPLECQQAKRPRTPFFHLRISPKAKSGRIFASNSDGQTKSASVTAIQSAKIMGLDQPCIIFNGQTEQSWQEATAVHLVEIAPSDLHTASYSSLKTIPVECYQAQLMQLSNVLEVKHVQYSEWHVKVILLHDNAWPHSARIAKESLEEFRWEVLSHPPVFRRHSSF